MQLKRDAKKLITYTLNLNPAIREVVANIFGVWAVSLSDVQKTGALRHWLAEKGLSRFYTSFMDRGCVSGTAGSLWQKCDILWMAPNE